MFQDRVAAGSRPRRVPYRVDELPGINTEIIRRYRQCVPPQRGHQTRGPFRLAAQVRGEGRADPDLLAVLTGLGREQLVDGVVDFVAGP